MLKSSFLKKALTLSVLLLSVNAQSALVNTDWKILGDNKVVLDEATGMEWLSLTETKLTSISYNTFVANMAVDFPGWNLALDSEVMTLSAHTTNKLIFKALIGETDGANSLIDPGGAYSYGMVLRANGILNLRGIGIGIDPSPGFTYTTTTAPALYNKNLPFYYAGVWLISGGGTSLTSINNPSINANNPNSPYSIAAAAVNAPLMLGGLSLSALLFGWRKKNS